MTKTTVVCPKCGEVVGTHGLFKGRKAGDTRKDERRVMRHYVKGVLCEAGSGLRVAPGGGKRRVIS